MLRTYRFRVYPNYEQINKILFTLEHCRVLYNRLLDERIHAYRDCGVSLNYYDQANTFKTRKRYVPALKEIHAQVLQDVARRLDKTFTAFFRRLRQGEKPGFPRFRGNNRYHSFTYPQYGNGAVLLDDGHIRLSKIGDVKIKLHRQPKGIVKTCTVIEKNHKFYVALACNVEAEPLCPTGKAVGVDIGITHLAITSDEQFFENAKFLRKAERRLKQLQRQVSKKRKGSHRRKKAVRQLARCHERVANQRKDAVHKLAHDLVGHYDLIAIEDLNVRGMLHNHHLAKSIADAGWHSLQQCVAYKAESAGRRVVFVDAKNTSQECASCGEIVKKTLAVRVHDCPHCGFVAHRDVNAAMNILKRAEPRDKKAS